MKKLLSPLRFIAFVSLFATNIIIAAAPHIFPLPLPEEKLIQTPDAYDRFAKNVWARLDCCCCAAETDRGSREVLALRVHLGAYLNDEAAAMAAVKRMREQQKNSELKAFTGVTTEAVFKALQKARGVENHPGFAETFQAEMRSALARLPRTPVMREKLEAEARKWASLSRDSILKELHAGAPSGDASKESEIARADRIVRAHHRLTLLLPLKTRMLEVLDEAIHGKIQKS